LSVILACLGGLGVLGALMLLVRNFDGFETFWVSYNPKRPFMYVLGIMLMLAVGAGGIGLLVGFNSAGQRRNELSRLAWVGFFVNAGIVTIALCAGLFFYFTRHPVAPAGG
jgi:hypothetical protein